MLAESPVGDNSELFAFTKLENGSEPNTQRLDQVAFVYPVALRYDRRYSVS